MISFQITFKTAMAAYPMCLPRIPEGAIPVPNFREPRPVEKKPDRKCKNLIRLGVDKFHAYAWSRTRKGGWAAAQSPMPGTTITLSRLRRKGYESMLSYNLKKQPEIQCTAVSANWRTLGGPDLRCGIDCERRTPS